MGAAPQQRPGAGGGSGGRANGGRELEVQLAPGEGPAWASVLGSAAELRGRLHRPRALLPAPPDRVLLAALPSGESALADGPRTTVDETLARGDFRAAAFMLGGWLSDRPGDPEALERDALVQSRSPPVPGLVPDALAAIEVVLRARDGGGGAAAGRSLRGAARHGWLQSSAYSVRGVVMPEGGTVLAEHLVPGAAVLGLSLADRRRAGIHHSVPAGEAHSIDVPGAPGGAPER